MNLKTVIFEPWIDQYREIKLRAAAARDEAETLRAELQAFESGKGRSELSRRILKASTLVVELEKAKAELAVKIADRVSDEFQ